MDIKYIQKVLFSAMVCGNKYIFCKIHKKFDLDILYDAILYNNINMIKLLLDYGYLEEFIIYHHDAANLLKYIQKWISIIRSNKFMAIWLYNKYPDYFPKELVY